MASDSQLRAACALREAPPSLPFHSRCNIALAKLKHGCIADGLSTVIHLVVLYRSWGTLPACAVTLALLHCALCAARACWRRSAHPSYPQWREVGVALLRLSTVPLMPLLIHHLMATTAAPTDGALASKLADATLPTLRAVAPLAALLRHVAILVFASGAPAMLRGTLGWRMRLSASALMQLALMAALCRQSSHVCASQLLSSPQAQARTRQLYQAFSLPSLAVLGSPLVAPGAHAQCASLLRFFTVALGFALPLAFQLAEAVAMFEQHERERRAAGLAPERGAHATAFAVASAWFRECGTELPLFCVVWVLTAVAWDCVTVASARPGLANF